MRAREILAEEYRNRTMLALALVVESDAPTSSMLAALAAMERYRAEAIEEAAMAVFVPDEGCGCGQCAGARNARSAIRALTTIGE